MYLSRLRYFFSPIEAISQKLETIFFFHFFRHRKKSRHFCPKSDISNLAPGPEYFLPRNYICKFAAVAKVKNRSNFCDFGPIDLNFFFKNWIGPLQGGQNKSQVRSGRILAVRPKNVGQIRASSSSQFTSGGWTDSWCMVCVGVWGLISRFVLVYGG